MERYLIGGGFENEKGGQNNFSQKIGIVYKSGE